MGDKQIYHWKKVYSQCFTLKQLTQYSLYIETDKLWEGWQTSDAKHIKVYSVIPYIHWWIAISYSNEYQLDNQPVILYHLYPRGQLYKVLAAPFFRPWHSLYSNTLLQHQTEKHKFLFLHLWYVTSRTRNLLVESKDATTEQDLDQFTLYKSKFIVFFSNELFWHINDIYVHCILFYSFL